MRYLLLLLPFAVAGCAYGTYPVGYGPTPAGYEPAPQYAAGYGYYAPPASPAYGYPATGYSAAAATNTENCGTPFDFKACPPMPRRPLAYYPANRS